MGKTKILLVEDEILAAEDIQKRLELLGYYVSAIVSTGTEAINKIEEKKPNLLLIDIKLKGEMTRIEATHHIITRFDIPVVYLLFNGDDKTIERPKKTAPFEYLLKPVKTDELQKAIEISLFRHKMEMAIKGNQKLYRSYVAGTFQIMWTINPDEKFASDILTWRALFTRQAEIAKREPRLLEAIHPDDRGKITDIFSRARKIKKPFEVNYRIKNSNKNYRQIVVHGVPVLEKTGRIREWIGFSEDITERKKLAGSPRLDRDQLINILNSMEDGVYIVNQQYDIEYVNLHLENEFGAPQGEKCFEYFYDRKKPCPWCKSQDVFAGKAIRSEWHLNKNDKTYDRLETPFRDYSGSISKLGIFHDITDRKKAEKELAHLNDELRDKSKELQEIINIASHDLRSPLINIQGSTKELEKELKDVTSIINEEAISPAVKKKLASLLEEDIAEECNYISACSSKMGALISGLVQVSKLGRIKLNITQLDMNKFVTSIAKSFDYQIQQTGTKLELEELPPCRGDVMQVNQVFSNLLDNALKYLSPNRPGVIKISGQRKREQVVYCVEDNGIGISARHQEKVFEIFHRLDPKAKTGEGLGLSIVSKIVNRHGGKVWVESEPEKGSKFFISLPA